MRLTYEDLEQVPGHLTAEIIDDRLFAAPLPALSHTQIAARIAATLVWLFGGGLGEMSAPGGWRILYEPQLRLADDVVVPDFAAWRHDRMPEVPEGRGFVLAPDWACEIVWPSTAALVRGRKMALYARAGVRHLWIVDQARRALDVHRLEAGSWTAADRYRQRRAMRAEPFEMVALDTRGWWPQH
jgi:Uma2 family endonuclease